MPITEGPMPSPTEAGAAAGSSGGWLTPPARGTGKPDRVGTGAAGNWLSTSGLTAGIPLCRGNKQTHSYSAALIKKGVVCSQFRFEACGADDNNEQGTGLLPVNLPHPNIPSRSMEVN